MGIQNIGGPTASLLCAGPYPQTSQDVGGGEPRSETHTDLGNEFRNLWAEVPPPLHALDVPMESKIKCGLSVAFSRCGITLVVTRTWG